GGRGARGGERLARRLRGSARAGRLAAPRARRCLVAALPRGVRRQDAADRQRSARRTRMSPEHVKVITTNRRARLDYLVEEKLECGIALTGTEGKSLREGSGQLSDAYAIGKSGELWLFNAQIPPYKPAGPLQNHDPKRTRKLLLHRRE